MLELFDSQNDSFPLNSRNIKNKAEAKKLRTSHLFTQLWTSVFPCVRYEHSTSSQSSLAAFIWRSLKVTVSTTSVIPVVRCLHISKKRSTTKEPPPRSFPKVSPKLCVCVFFLNKIRPKVSVHNGQGPRRVDIAFVSHANSLCGGSGTYNLLFLYLPPCCGWIKSP